MQSKIPWAYIINFMQSSFCLVSLPFLLFVNFTALSLPAYAGNSHQHSSSGLSQNVVPYRAIYDITLENRAEKSSLTGLSGRMAYEFSGSKCSGWKTQFRFLTQIDIRDDASILTDKRGDSFESANGKMLRFKTENYVDGDLTDEVVGAVTRTKKGLEVALDKPEGEIYKLQNADFPFMQMEYIVQSALKGRHFIKMRLFDGTDNPYDVTETTVIIGHKEQPKTDDHELKFMGPYAKESVWPITISYFEDSEHNNGLPSFRTKFLLYENGITRDLFIDYGDFSIRGKLVRLDLLPSQKNEGCK